MYSVADVSYGNEFGILFPLAVCSLRELSLGNSKNAKEMREMILRPPEALQSILCQTSKLAEAISHLHTNIKGEFRQHHKAVHGDLHLNNIVIATRPTEKSKAGEWKVIDFGLSVIREEAPLRTGYTKIASMNTRRYGTGANPPPEFAMDDAISPKNDVYCFGCILASILAFLLGGQCGAVKIYKNDGEWLVRNQWGKSVAEDRC